MLSANPTTQEIFRARIFEEPLVPIGAQPTPAENSAVAAALTSYSKRSGPDDFSGVTGFLEAYVNTPWHLALLTNLGFEYYKAGYYSKALDAWMQAWALARPITAPAEKPLADRAIGELAYMLARVGRMTELEHLMQSIEGRAFCGPATEKIAGAREGLVSMRLRPEISFRCGPLALHRIKLALHPHDPRTALIEAAASTQQGFSLRQVADLSEKVGLEFQMAFRDQGAEFVIPSVVHFKVAHFAALIRRTGDRYLLQDPTFRSEAWVTREALEAEASGYFLIPPGELPQRWRAVEAQEAEAVWGKGFVPDPPDPPGPCDHTSDRCKPSCKGLAVSSVHLLNASLNINDEPVGYSPPVGPAVRFTVRYNQRDNQFSSTFNYSNFGLKWTFDWLAYIKDDPSNSSADVVYYIMGGGNRTFTGAITDTVTSITTYAPQLIDQTKLVHRTSPDSYEMISSDGTRKIFGRSDGAVPPATTRKFFLTQTNRPVRQCCYAYL